MKTASVRIAVLLVILCAARVWAQFVTDVQKPILKERAQDVLLLSPATGPITVDGKLDEPAWQKAAVIREWRDFPSGTVTAINAEARVLYTAQTIYVGFNVTGPGAADALRTPKKPDDYGGSLVEVFLTPSRRDKWRVQFVANPIGLRYDARDSQKSWNGEWTSAGQVRADGWSLEMAIASTNLNHPELKESFYFRGNICYVAPNGQAYSWTGGWGDFPGLGALFFGDEKSFLATLQPSLALWLDREVYDLRDVTGVALARVANAGGRIGDFALSVRVRQGEKEVLAQNIAPLPAQDVDLTLDMKSLPPGAYDLVAELTRDGKAVATANRPFRKEKRPLIPEGPRAGRIALPVPAQPEAAGVAWAVSTGVPFAQDVLWSEENVRLLGPDGKEAPCQTEVRARWNRRGSIQWLGLTFVRVLSDKPQDYVIEYGPQVRRAAAGPVKVEESAGAVTVTTDRLKFTVRKKGFGLIDSLWVDAAGAGKWEQLLASGGGAYLVDHEGVRYEAALDRDAEVVVEERGPVAATVCATGWYVKQGSAGARTSCELPTDRLCRFRIRLKAAAGSPLLQCETATVLTYDSEKVRLRDLALVFPVRGMQSAALGMEKAPPVLWDEARLRKGAWLVQHRWDKSVDDAGALLGQAAGWVEARTPAGPVVLAARHFWKKFPKEIEAKDGALVLHLWPGHGQENAFPQEEQLAWENIYKFWYAHQGRELDFRFPEAYYTKIDADYNKKKGTPEQFSNYYTEMKAANAQGVCLYNEFLLGVGLRPDTAAWLAEKQPHAVPDPAYACGTGVFGPVLHADMERFGPLEKTLERGFASLAGRTLPNNEYGQLIFGGEHTYWTYHAAKPCALVHRVWINGHYQIPTAMIMQYARTGQAPYLERGREFWQNLRDIAMVHYVSSERRFPWHELGAMYHCKGFAPWAGDAYIGGHPMTMDFLFFDYCLTGSRRSLDAYRTWIEGIKKVSPPGFASREGISTVSDLVLAYRMTWDPALVELMERSVDRLFNKPLNVEDAWDWNPLLPLRYIGLTGSERVTQAFRTALTGASGHVMAGGYMALNGYFALLDNRPELVAKYPYSLYGDSLSVVDEPGAYGDGLVANNWMEFAYYLNKLPIVLKAMKEYNLGLARPPQTKPALLPAVKGGAWIAVREEADGAVPLKLLFADAPAAPVRVRVTRADGVEALLQDVTLAKGVKETALAIPADGQAAEYLIHLSGAVGGLAWPVTPLAKEVAFLPAGRAVLTPAGNWYEAQGVRLYFQAPPAAPPTLTVGSDNKRGAGIELVDARGGVLARAGTSRYIGRRHLFNVPKDAPGPLSLYFSEYAYVDLPGPAGLWVGLTPEALFEPKAKPPEPAGGK
jgi:hypothetical protein